MGLAVPKGLRVNSQQTAFLLKRACCSETSAQRHVAAWTGGEWGAERTHVWSVYGRVPVLSRLQVSEGLVHPTNEEPLNIGFLLRKRTQNN